MIPGRTTSLRAERRPCGHLSRPMRGILWRPARADGSAGKGDAGGGVLSLASAAGGACRGAGERRGGDREGALPRLRMRRLPRRSGHGGRGNDRPGSDPHRVPAIGRHRHAAADAGRISRASLPTASTSSRAIGCLRSEFSPTPSSRRCPPISWASGKDVAQGTKTPFCRRARSPIPIRCRARRANSRS